MGEGKKLEHERNIAEKHEKKEPKARSALAPYLLAGGVLIAGAALGRCASNGTTPNDAATDSETDAPQNSCTKIEKARANVKAASGWGYDMGESQKRCSETSGCAMGMNIGDEIMIANSGVDEKWVVDNMTVSDEGDKVTLKNVVSDDGRNYVFGTKTIEIQAGGSLYTDGIENAFIDAQLIGVCRYGTCENGVSVDDWNATGKALLSLSVLNEDGTRATKRILLTDLESTTVTVGRYTVDLMLIKATESQAYVTYNVTSGGSAKSDLGKPVDEGYSVEVLPDVSLDNEVSSDSSIATCSRLTVTFEITDRAEEGGEPFEAEFSEYDTLYLDGKEYKISSILAEMTGPNRDVIHQNKSAVKLLEGGSETVLYFGETMELDTKSVLVKSINGYRPVQE
ncbi:hypothetical protein H0O02_04400 [Candidatus Micrarchaeota archaeon]|nr:hypothetical protein [Candidatus Micrarchaeota archaeon]